MQHMVLILIKRKCKRCPKSGFGAIVLDGFRLAFKGVADMRKKAIKFSWEFIKFLKNVR